MLQNGADANHADISGMTALHQAAAFGNYIRAIKKFNFRLNISRSGREKVVELLIRHNAEVNKKNGRGKTALHLAAERGSLSIMAFKKH